MLAITTTGRSFDDEDQFDYQLRAHTVDGEPPGFLYMLLDDHGMEWAFQPIIDGERSKLLRTLPEDQWEEWLSRNRVRERISSQLYGLPPSREPAS